MGHKPETILGISPGTRYLGFAILRHRELLDWGVKAFKGPWSDEKEEKILSFLETLILKWMITGVSSKRVDPTRSSPELLRLRESLRKLVKEYKMGLSEASIKEIKDGQRNPMEWVTSLTKRYGEMEGLLEKERRSNVPYYRKVFEAVALAEKN